MRYYANWTEHDFPICSFNSAFNRDINPIISTLFGVRNHAKLKYVSLIDLQRCIRSIKVNNIEFSVGVWYQIYKCILHIEAFPMTKFRKVHAICMFISDRKSKSPMMEFVKPKKQLNAKIFTNILNIVVDKNCTHNFTLIMGKVNRQVRDTDLHIAGCLNWNYFFNSCSRAFENYCLANYYYAIARYYCRNLRLFECF